MKLARRQNISPHTNSIITVTLTGTEMVLKFKVTSNKSSVDTILTQQTLYDLNFNAGGENFGNSLLCIFPETVSNNCCRLDRWQKLR